MMNTRIGPWEWLCGWCCSLSSCCKNVCSFHCPRCSCCSCKCTCVPLLCPTDEDRLKVEEVSGADYIHEKKVVKAKIRKDTRTKAALRRLGGFIVGIFLTTLYALIVLFIKNYNLWFCLTTTVTLGLFLTLGMAFSVRVRITVLLMLPQIFTAASEPLYGVQQELSAHHWLVLSSCNDELEQPYIKCNNLFDEAKNSCFKVMSFMGFLCYILDVFRPLCGLTDINHDNIYISREFIELDVMRVKQNRNALLPLSSSEGYEFIRPGSLTLTKREKKGYVFEIINVFRSLLVALLMVVLDYVFYWVLDLVSHLMRGEVVVRSPLVFSLLVNGTGEINDIYKTIVSAFDVIQNSNITIQTTKCQVRPSEPDYLVYILIGFLHGITFFIAIFGIYMQRLKRYICAYYYPTREQMRICFLYNKLLTKRMYVEKSLLQSLRTNEADKGHTNILLILAAKCPCLFGWLANFLGANEQYCTACAQICAGKESEEYSSCSTFGCRAIYCQGCSKILNNACILCMAPLVCVEAKDEEIDSSDDEKVTLMMEAMKSMKKEEKAKRKKLKKAVKHRLKETIKRRKSDQLLKKYKESMASSDSGESDVDAGDDSGESDFEYQKSKADDSFDITDWESPSQTSLLDANLIPLTKIPKKTTREDKRSRKERDMEKGPDCH